MLLLSGVAMVMSFVSGNIWGGIFSVSCVVVFYWPQMKCLFSILIFCLLLFIIINNNNNTQKIIMHENTTNTDNLLPNLLLLRKGRMVTYTIRKREPPNGMHGHS